MRHPATLPVFHRAAMFGALGLLAGLLLTGCHDHASRGGATPAAPSAPAMALATLNINTFSFSWGEVAGATEYRLLEDPDGVSGYTEVAVLAAGTTNHDIEVFLPGRVNASYILQACNDTGCSSSSVLSVSSTLVVAATYVKASNTAENDYFGSSIALAADGNTLAVSAPGEDSSATGSGGDESNNAASSSGAVYVFTRSGATWSQQAYLKASNTGAGDGFGDTLSLSADGSTLAVGALVEASNASGIDSDQSNNAAIFAGAVYVFTRVGSTWSQQAYVKASNAEGGDLFGRSIALAADGNTLAVGANGEASNATGIDGDQSNNAAPNSGAVYVFTRAGSTWSQQAYVKSSNSESGDDFGIRLALAGDGNTLAVGAYGEDSNATGIDGDESNNTGYSSGAVYVFTRAGSTWSQQAYVKASNSEMADEFGLGLALAADGNTLAVGAHGEDSNATGIDGDESNNTASSAGAVYVFSRSGAAWSQQAYVKASNAEASDVFGFNSLALSADGNTLAVGALGEASNATGIGGDESSNTASSSGAVYVFSRSGTTWLQKAYIKAPNTAANDYFGGTLAFAGDGNTLAVGAYGEDSNATGIDGAQGDDTATDSGAVYLY